jgi:hypothetical protein
MHAKHWQEAPDDIRVFPPLVIINQSPEYALSCAIFCLASVSTGMTPDAAEQINYHSPFWHFASPLFGDSDFNMI